MLNPSTTEQLFCKVCKKVTTHITERYSDRSDVYAQCIHLGDVLKYSVTEPDEVSGKQETYWFQL